MATSRKRGGRGTTPPARPRKGPFPRREPAAASTITLDPRLLAMLDPQQQVSVRQGSDASLREDLEELALPTDRAYSAAEQSYVHAVIGHRRSDRALTRMELARGLALAEVRRDRRMIEDLWVVISDLALAVDRLAASDGLLGLESTHAVPALIDLVRRQQHAELRQAVRDRVTAIEFTVQVASDVEGPAWARDAANCGHFLFEHLQGGGCVHPIEPSAPEPCPCLLAGPRPNTLKRGV